MVEEANNTPKLILAVDPGRDKCGLALIRSDRTIIEKAVVPASAVGEAVARILHANPEAVLVMGDRTAAAETAAALRAGLHVSPRLVDEHRSTEQGRRRYFRDNPRRGWRRLLPVGLQTPPRPYDDYVAVVIAERYLDSLRVA